MNLLFYMALRTLPLGIAIAIEFTGPLTLAVALSRRAIDCVWIGCAIAGLVPLIPTGQSVHDLDPVGIAYVRWARRCAGRSTSSSARWPATCTADRPPRSA